MYEINELLNKINSETVGKPKQRLYRSDETAKKQEQKFLVLDTRFKSYENAINDLDFSKYSDKKREGFNQCFEKYRKIANNNSKNLDIIYENLNVDMKECQNKLKESGSSDDFFVIGYKDCLKIIDYFLLESKKAFFKKLADRIK